MVGTVPIGGGSPVTIQSMATADTKDFDAVSRQIKSLANCGCDLVRIALYDRACALSVPRLVEASPVPLIADVHFDAEIAVAAIEHGIPKVRINPGNIGNANAVQRVVDAARAHGVPLRVGANGGSLPRDLRSMRVSEALAAAALREVQMLERMHFHDIVISVKSSSTLDCIDAARLVACRVPYPLHLGVTEAGIRDRALVKSAIGIGALLADGIGDTIRVSFSGNPMHEIEAARRILEACGMRRAAVEIISCPTCARCAIDVERIVQNVEKLTEEYTTPVTIAVMGCAVNGPGEARRANVGLAGAPDGVVLFEAGHVVGTEHSVDAALRALAELLSRYEARHRKHGGSDDTETLECCASSSEREAPENSAQTESHL